MRVIRVKKKNWFFILKNQEVMRVSEYLFLLFCRKNKSVEKILTTSWLSWIILENKIMIIDQDRTSQSWCCLHQIFLSCERSEPCSSHWDLHQQHINSDVSHCYDNKVKKKGRSRLSLTSETWSVMSYKEIFDGFADGNFLMLSHSLMSSIHQTVDFSCTPTSHSLLVNVSIGMDRFVRSWNERMCPLQKS